MREYIFIDEPMITATELLTRWPAMSRNDILDLVNDDGVSAPVVYILHSTHVDNNRQYRYKCTICNKTGIKIDELKINEIDIAYKLSDIAKYESDKEYLKWKITSEKSELFPIHNTYNDMNCKIAEKEKELDEKNAIIADLRNKACNGQGLPSVVCRMRREGKTDAEIAHYLSDDGKWCSMAQIGALLHDGGAEHRVAARSMQQLGNRLLDKG